MENYVFIGNRFYVYRKMRELGCNVTKVYAVKNSFLERELQNENISYIPLESKEQLCNNLMDDEWDTLVSNGCPYILPISYLQNGHRKFINVHPSLLPDLKGRHPINGAILYARDHGVTCHYMTDKIDEGSVISQIKIPKANELDLELLYRISFMAEGDAFEEAFKKRFEPIANLNSKITPIYYSRKESDLIINNSDPVDVIIRKVKAFSIEGLYAKFIHQGMMYCVEEVLNIMNGYTNRMFSDSGNNKILLVIGNKKILVKHKEAILLLKLTTCNNYFFEGDQWIDNALEKCINTTI